MMRAAALNLQSGVEVETEEEAYRIHACDDKTFNKYSFPKNADRQVVKET